MCIGFEAQSDNDIAAECDIGKLLDAGTDLQRLSREEKYCILTANPSLDSSSYPRTRPYASGAFCQFQPDWLWQYPWLHYSKHVDGVFCRACSFFAHDKVGGQSPGQFVTKPFKTWPKKTQALSTHAKASYHAASLAKMSEFVKRYKNPSQAIDTKLSSQAQKTIEENKKVIESLLHIVMLCGKQGLALRGHRDDNIVWASEGDEAANHGNFIELVRFRAETDEVLRNHLQSDPKNAVYTSKTIQNELVQIIGTKIRNDILREVEQAKFFTVIADEKTDVSNKDQLSIALRYVLKGTVKEVFVDFVEVERIIGQVLADAIVQSLATWGLSLAHLRGQYYDGASNMSGAVAGCKSIIQQQAPKAVYFHCAAHRLNLAIVSACSIQAFKNTEAYIGEIARFFNNSAKRQHLLDSSMDSVASPPKAKKLKDACQTRWIQRIDSYVVFLELLPAVHKTLQAMTWPHLFEDLGAGWKWDTDIITKANGFLHQLESSLFLVCFKILFEVLTCLRGLTVKLQQRALDVHYAYKEVDNVISVLKSLRDNSEKEFARIFEEACKLGQKLHGNNFELNQPRVVRRQVHRSNVGATSAVDYFRITYYNEFLSHVVAELQIRFNSNAAHGVGLLHLLPSHNEDADIEIKPELEQAVDFYKEDLPLVAMFPTEYRTWVWKWKQEPPSEFPSTLADALQHVMLLPSLI